MQSSGPWLGAEPRRPFSFEDDEDDFGPPPSEFHLRPGRIWAPDEVDRRGLAPVPYVDVPGEWEPWKEQAEPDQTDEARPEPERPAEAGTEPERPAEAGTEPERPAEAGTEPERPAEAEQLPLEPVIVPPGKFEFKRRQVKSKREASEWFKAPRAFYEDHLDSDEEREQRDAVKARRGGGYGDEPPRPRKLGRSVYDALQTHGHFGLVDGGETVEGGVRRLVVHVPKRNRGYVLDIRPGEVIYANSARGLNVGGRLDVLFVSGHRYVPPGHAVTSCVIGVPYAQWRRFLE
jgi:hypothetical protein